MSNVKTTCLRFNLDNPEHAKAWRSLKQADTKFLASFMISLKSEYPVNVPAATENTAESDNNSDYSDIDLDFIGG